MKGRQVKLFLVDGTPGGLTTAEITNWTGSVVTARRSDLGELLRREECKRTGVYLLLGDDPDTPTQLRCYVGEADVVAVGLSADAKDEAKAFWNQAVVVTAKGTHLTKSHVRYLESRLVDLAVLAGRVTIANSTRLALPTLPEADVSDMEYFIGQLQIILPVLGVNAIRVRPERREASEPVAIESPIFTLTQARRGIDARAQLVDGEFTLLENSYIAPSWGSARKDGYYSLYESLRKEGAIVIEGGRARTTRDIPFSAPSAASSVAVGRASNGRKEWMTPDGTYDQWEKRGIDDVITEF